MMAARAEGHTITRWVLWRRWVLAGAIHGLALVWLLRGRLTETPHDVGLQPPGR